MEQYSVTGMSCAACSARVEKAVSAVEGVSSCAVSLLTNSMGVDGSAEPAKIIAAVREAGYGAALKRTEKGSAAGGQSALPESETPLLKRRLIASLALLLPLMYISMGHSMWGWPLPQFLDSNPVAAALTQLLLTVAVAVINQRFFISGFKSLLRGAPNMDTLVALGASASFIYSVIELYAMSALSLSAGVTAAAEHTHNLYFESAAMILTLITVGKLLEARSKGRTTDALKSLIELMPKTAVVLRGGVETEIPASEVRVGDIFVVRPGQAIPVDGVVTEGSAAVNEAALTGESVPTDKLPGDEVSAATLNQSGFLVCRAARVGEDTALAQVISMVSDAAATKAPIARLADRVSGVFVPAVMAIAALTFAVWLISGESAAYALARGISVLVISCPCALGLATPVAVMVGSGLGAKNGLLFKTAASLEETGKADIVVLDKTGTLTRGEPKLTDIWPAPGIDRERLLETACALEIKSEHPLAKAVMAWAGENSVKAPEAEQFREMPGSGLSGRVDGLEAAGGNMKYIAGLVPVSPEAESKVQELSAQGKTPLLFCRGGELLGVLAVADVLKSDSADAVQSLKNMGLQVVMLTGDNQRTADAIGAQAGVDRVIAGVLPQGKEAVVRSLKRQGRVVMVGDGINDAPALTAADIGIAIGAGTDVAIDAADVVLMGGRMSDVPAAIRLSRATLKNIRENLFWAFIYNVVGIPLAAGLWIPIFGWTLEPMFAAAAMSLSSFCVVTNALRLNLFKLRDGSRDAPRRKKQRASGELLTLSIDGMMCSHCEAAVKAALEGLSGVESAEADYKTGTATVTAKPGIDDGELKRAIEGADYVLKEIKREGRT